MSNGNTEKLRLASTGYCDELHKQLVGLVGEGGEPELASHLYLLLEKLSPPIAYRPGFPLTD
ncbi:MAG TPA: hypothetical protein VIH69_01865 [Dehalococcoidia bacterium]